MSEDKIYLVTVYTEGQLLKTAIKIKPTKKTDEAFQYFMKDIPNKSVDMILADLPLEEDSTEVINKILPLHAQGKIVEVEELFELVDLSNITTVEINIPEHNTP